MMSEQSVSAPGLLGRQNISGRVTSADVARLAGVSQSAVSRVFTDGASASAKTSAKVKEAAETLGYRPNRLARSLLTGKSYMVGLVVAYLDNYFYPEVLEKLSKALQQQGYHVLMFMAEQTANNIDEVVEEILEYQGRCYCYCVCCAFLRASR
jgi:DNA-binding LacI/PurR family transcriptional regulator